MLIRKCLNLQTPIKKHQRKQLLPALKPIGGHTICVCLEYMNLPFIDSLILIHSQTHTHIHMKIAVCNVNVK